jgi:MYXO-CTERM domain-containing protein
MSGLGGPQGYGTNCMPPNDDGSWPAGSPGLDLTPAFPSGIHFYSGTYTTGWINNNGNLSFSGPINTYTPDAFPGAPQPMIAPYWADVDTRDASECDSGDYPSGGGYPAGATCMNPATNGVWWSLTPGQFVVTWDQVGYFLCHPTPVMSFQMILTSAPDCGGSSGIDFNIEFRYATCGWEAGDASGGSGGFCPAGSVGLGCTPAQAGFDSAEMPDTNYASLPMSRMAGISTELCTGSNLTPAQPGIWQFLVRGGNILCPTAGQACMTGMPGICAQGVLQCTATGGTTCAPLETPQPSKCNGLDNNCDGMIDTGPCPAGEVCDGEECVSQCNEGSCPQGETCTAMGVCVATDCVNVTCPSGERCVGGTCVDACTGITCPIGQVCRLGECVNPCAGLNCGMGQVCENGMCVPTCPCTACSASQTCEPADAGPLAGECVATDCLNVTCPAGQVCQAGACIDACTDAVCPSGQVCQTGMCVASAMMDAGTDSGGGLIMPGSEGGADGAVDSGTAFGADHVKGSCGCRMAESGSGRPWTIGLLAGLAAMIRRRRRRLT